MKVSSIKPRTTKSANYVFSVISVFLLVPTYVMIFG